MVSAFTPHSKPTSNWQQYLDLLESKRIPGNQRKWYVAHVEKLLDRTGKRPLSELSQSDVEAYFTDTLATMKSDWQARQLVDAIQLLLVDLVKAPAAELIDWSYWKNASQSITDDHPTLARFAADNIARQARGEPVIEQLIKQIRTRHYSIRTEKSYVDWVRRFLAFSDKPVEQLDRQDVERFLSHLAVDRQVAPSTQNAIPWGQPA